MLGREAYHDPWSMAGWDWRFFGVRRRRAEREQVEAALGDYLEGLHAAGQPWSHAMRHVLGLWNGAAGRAPLASGVVGPSAEGAVAARKCSVWPMRPDAAKRLTPRRSTPEGRYPLAIDGEHR